METTETMDFLLMAGQSDEAMATQTSAGWPDWSLFLGFLLLAFIILAIVRVSSWFRMAMRIDLEGINL